MKRLLLICLLCAVFVVGCDKEEEQSDVVVSNSEESVEVQDNGVVSVGVGAEVEIPDEPDVSMYSEMSDTEDFSEYHEDMNINQGSGSLDDFHHDGQMVNFSNESVNEVDEADMLDSLDDSSDNDPFSGDYTIAIRR